MLLKQQIEDKGIKQTWIAKKVGVSKVLLHHYLSGKTSMPQVIETKIRNLLK